jgi:hypothetical protein
VAEKHLFYCTDLFRWLLYATCILNDRTWSGVYFQVCRNIEIYKYIERSPHKRKKIGKDETKNIYTYI